MKFDETIKQLDAALNKADEPRHDIASQRCGRALGAAKLHLLAFSVRCIGRTVSWMVWAGLESADERHIVLPPCNPDAFVVRADCSNTDAEQVH